MASWDVGKLCHMMNVALSSMVAEVEKSEKYPGYFEKYSSKNPDLGGKITDLEVPDADMPFVKCFTLPHFLKY